MDRIKLIQALLLTTLMISPMYVSKGFNLIEVVITMAVVTILLLVMRPSWVYSMAYSRASAEISTIYQDLKFGRHLAVNNHNTVTTCPLDQANQCHNDWTQGYAVFIDGATKGQFDDDDQLLLERGPIDSKDLIRSSRNQVRFTPDGFTGNTGSIRYCPLSADHPLRRQITISATGGIRYNNKPGNC
ncbi:GspH/FimT family pseudopilin [Ferrimonas lipolytica]|uniref:Type II secretion system protein H n=1 Tax=Ferrimonas lipolytica TaxID=2724191 RepID=A0A6H1UCG5_9GAMM|nr:GspH/FimT family pseudopilin [Ferrimonas lipolytica]QIZ75502.1 prepilin-type N-terminal cleavage/methylation domain-containing protein [Ferrimonas lipolytica]